MDPYISTLYEIATRGRNTNSYKFALWRALARLAPDTLEGDSLISKDELAPLFLEYYWPLEVRYRIRQGINPDKDPIVMVLIRELRGAGKIAEGETLSGFKKRMPHQYQKLLDTVARRAFDDVIPRFHTVHGTQIDPKVFTFEGKAGKAGNNIRLTTGGRRFLTDYGKLIDYVAVSGWVRFTEQFTSAPRLHDKIENRNLKRGNVSKWREFLSTIQNGECFYGKGHEMVAPEVDHVVPWSFVLEDKTWNLVLSCHKCNNEKWDKLPDQDAVERLCVRNEQIITIPTNDRFCRNFEEWRSRDLSSHIRGLYDQATADGFPNWR